MKHESEFSSILKLSNIPLYIYHIVLIHPTFMLHAHFGYREQCCCKHGCEDICASPHFQISYAHAQQWISGSYSTSTWIYRGKQAEEKMLPLICHQGSVN